MLCVCVFFFLNEVLIFFFSFYMRLVVLVLIFAALVAGQYWKVFGPDGDYQPQPRLSGDERRARYRDDNGQQLNKDERRAFIQGKWDARRFARNKVQGQTPTDPNLADVYQRG